MLAARELVFSRIRRCSLCRREYGAGSKHHDHGYELQNEPLPGQYCCLAPRFERLGRGCYCLIEFIGGGFRDPREECLCRLLRRDLKS